MRKMTLFVGVDQWAWLRARGSASLIIRKLIDQHIRNTKELEDPREFEDWGSLLKGL